MLPCGSQDVIEPANPGLANTLLGDFWRQVQELFTQLGVAPLQTAQPDPQ